MATILVRTEDVEAVNAAMAATDLPYPGLRTTFPAGMWVAEGVAGAVLDAAIDAGAVVVDVMPELDDRLDGEEPQ